VEVPSVEVPSAATTEQASIQALQAQMAMMQKQIAEQQAILAANGKHNHKAMFNEIDVPILYSFHAIHTHPNLPVQSEICYRLSIFKTPP